MNGISSNQTVQGLANTVSEVGATKLGYFFDYICYMWFGIVMLKIYFTAKLAFVDGFSLQFIELLQCIS